MEMKLLMDDIEETIKNAKDGITLTQLEAKNMCSKDTLVYCISALVQYYKIYYKDGKWFA